MDMYLDDIMVKGIEENMRGPEHFNEFILSAEASGLNLPEELKP